MSKRLLILVDDEPVTSRTLALDLADAGYSVETAADRREAMRMMERTPFDLLIALERRGGGRALVEEFRRVRPGAKVVLMTTDTDALETLEWRDAVARVKKPFDLEDIRSAVEGLLGNDAQEREVTTTFESGSRGVSRPVEATGSAVSGNGGPVDGPERNLRRQ